MICPACQTTLKVVLPPDASRLSRVLCCPKCSELPVAERIAAAAAGGPAPVVEITDEGLFDLLDKCFTTINGSMRASGAVSLFSIAALSAFVNSRYRAAMMTAISAMRRTLADRLADIHQECNGKDGGQ